MINFGTSYYLKLLGLNPKPKKTELMKRLFPKPDQQPYDFHRMMRLIAGSHVVGDFSKGTTEQRIAAITQSAERDSAAFAISKLDKWLDGRKADSSDLLSMKKISQSQKFSVTFKADLKIETESGWMNIHLWNTKRPDINEREAAACLGLFFDQAENKKIGILNLRTSELLTFNDTKRPQELARLLMADIDRRLEEILDSHDRPSNSERPSEQPRL